MATVTTTDTARSGATDDATDRAAHASSADAGVRRRPAASASLEWVLAHPVLQRFNLHEDNRRLLPAAVLAVAIGAWVRVFGTLIVQRHDRFGTFDHDLGIWDQAVWLLAHGESLITVRGLEVFGFHASPALYLFVPFFWLGGGVNLLNLAMTAVLALGSVAVFRAGRHHLGDDWHALVPALAFLVNYAGQWMIWETFHPEVLAITPLLFAYVAAIKGRWRSYAVWLLLAVTWKEDVALAVAMLGFLLAVRGTRTVGARAAARAGVVKPPGPARTRLVGLLTIAGAVVWFLVATRLVIPAFSSGGNFTEALFGDLGSSPTEIAGTAVTQPDLVVEHLERSDPLDYMRQLTGSFGFASLLAPLALLMALPQLLINTLAIYDFFWTTRVHYAALPLFATAVATVEGLARVHRAAWRRALLGAVAVGAFFTAVSWGISPVSPEYREGFWPLEVDGPRQAELDRVVAMPGPGDSVSAVYNLVPHLTHRSEIYTFPNPWRASNWGVDGELLPDPSGVDWLILDPSAIAKEEQPILLAVLANPDRPVPPTGDEALGPDQPWSAGEAAARADRRYWEVRVDEPRLLVLRRTGR